MIAFYNFSIACLHVMALPLVNCLEMRLTLQENFTITLFGKNALVKVSLREMTNGSEVHKVYHYAVVIEMDNKKNKLVNLYRHLCGEWITDAETDTNTTCEIKKQIAILESDA